MVVRYLHIPIIFHNDGFYYSTIKGKIQYPYQCFIDHTNFRLQIGFWRREKSFAAVKNHTVANQASLQTIVKLLIAKR